MSVALCVGTLAVTRLALLGISPKRSAVRTPGAALEGPSDRELILGLVGGVARTSGLLLGWGRPSFEGG